MEKSKRILKVLETFNKQKNSQLDWPYIKLAIEASVANNQPLSLINFTCSTINSEYMFDKKNPELYVNLDPTGNNLETDLPLLTRLYLELIKIHPVRIIILIGNTDPFYIYTEETR